MCIRQRRPSWRPSRRPSWICIQDQVGMACKYVTIIKLMINKSKLAFLYLYHYILVSYCWYICVYLVRFRWAEGSFLNRVIDPFGVICRLGTTRQSISHTRKWLKPMRNQNGIDSYCGSLSRHIFSDRQ